MQVAAYLNQFNLTSELLPLVNGTVPDVYRREMRGMASMLNVSFDDLLTASLIGDLEDSVPGGVWVPSCTSIVAQRSNGTIYHARNQDHPRSYLGTTVQVDFVKGGALRYTATQFAGTVGMTGSALLPGKWSWSINSRRITFLKRSTDTIKTLH